MAAGDFKNGSALTGGILAQGQSSTSAAAAYTVSASQYVKLAKVVFCNESTSTVTVSYGIAKSGNTVGAAGTFAAKTLSLGVAGSATSVLDATELDGAIIGPGDAVWTQASAGTSVTYTVSGAVSA